VCTRRRGRFVNGLIENREVTRNQAMAAAVLNDVTKPFGTSEGIGSRQDVGWMADPMFG
jgi:hypothetical protein